MEENILSPTAKLQNLDSLWDPLDPAASEARFRALMPDRQSLTGKEQSYVIELLALVARAEALQGKYAEAHVSLKAAEQLLSKDGQATIPAEARLRWLLESGRIHVLEKTPSQARSLLAEAWTLATSSGADGFVVDVAQMMAVIENPKAQQEWILRAIEIAERSTQANAKRLLGGLYMTSGWKHFDMRQYEKSLEIFQKAITHCREVGSKREAFVAKWATGKVLRALGKTEEALAIQQNLLGELGIGGERDGRLYEEIAECLQSLRREPEAQLYFELAYRELSDDEWVTDNQPVKLKRMKDLGKVKGS